MSWDVWCSNQIPIGIEQTKALRWFKDAVEKNVVCTGHTKHCDILATVFVAKPVCSHQWCIAASKKWAKCRSRKAWLSF